MNASSVSAASLQAKPRVGALPLGVDWPDQPGEAPRSRWNSDCAIRWPASTDYRGESPKAFVKLKEGAEPVDEAGMIAFLKERLGKHEIPGEVEFRTELPKTLIGKLSKKELVQEEQEKYEARKAAG